MPETVKFPTEVIDLPSRGHFYAKDNPLSSGQVEIKYMTAKEEDILTSETLIRKGIVVDYLLKELIVDKKIKLQDMLLGDKNAILISARILAYGKQYKFEAQNSEKDMEEFEVDLTKIENTDIDFDSIVMDKNGEVEFKLPQTERVVKFRVMTSGQMDEVDTQVKSLQKVSGDIDKTLTTRLKNQIREVDGNRDRPTINNFVDKELFALDSLALRGYIVSVTPDLNMDLEFTDKYGKEIKAAVPITAEFCWPPS